jgi:hypothetical protein
MSKPTEQIIQILKDLTNKVDNIETIINSRLDSLEARMSKLDTLSTTPSAVIPKGTTEKTAKKDTKKITIAKPIKKGNITIDIYNDNLLVTGETFDRKDLIKSLGGKWNGEHKGWTIPTKNAEEAKEKLETYCSNVEYSEHNSNLLSISTVNKVVNQIPNRINTEAMFLDDDE